MAVNLGDRMLNNMPNGSSNVGRSEGVKPREFPLYVDVDS